MADGATDPDQLLRLAIDCLRGHGNGAASPSVGVGVGGDVGGDLDGYVFTPVDGATQATVWKGEPKGDQPAVALRLTPKPLELIRRVAALVDDVRSVTCPTTVATERLQVGDRTWTVHLCTWIGIGAPDKTNMDVLGRQLAQLHVDLASSPVDVTDRKLSFEPSPTPPAEQQLPAWYIARHLWRDRIFAWLSTQARQMAAQPIHGDLHWGNVVATPKGYGFIDFDKVMFAPPVFDLAKLIATGMFRGGDQTRSQVRFQARKTTQLLEGYESVRPLSAAELVALEALAVLLNGETARLGTVYDNENYRRDADAVASWWIARRGRTRDPLRIRTSRRPASDDTTDHEQPPLWTDEPDTHTDTDTGTGRPEPTGGPDPY